MSFFRSERMSYCQLVMHQETAFDCLVELGYLGKVQFIDEYDKDHVPNMKFVNEVQRCSEAQRIIQKLQEEVNKNEMVSFYYPNVDEDEIPVSTDLQQIETSLQRLELELTEVLRHCDALLERRLYLTEQREVTLKANDFFTGAQNTESQITSYGSLMKDIINDSSKAETGRVGDKIRPLNLLLGAIPIERTAAFEVMVWRISRGNAYVKIAQFELPDEITKNSQSRYKNAFAIVYVGTELTSKLTKICQAFQAKLYACPVVEGERLKVLKELDTELADLQAVFQKTCEHKRRVLMASIPFLYIWRSKLRKIHAVYVTLNRLGTVRELRNQNQKYLQADCWIPKKDVPAARAALLRGARRSARGDVQLTFPPILHERGHHRAPPPPPPTYFETNKFTYGFQVLINSYGFPAYQELNPAPFTIITFPFLFSVMFGDVGHGLIMALFGFFMIRREKKIERGMKDSMKSNEIYNILFGGRYIIFLMGCFSIYTGFMYNDVLSKPLNIFGSSWHVNETYESFKAVDLSLDPVRKDNYVGTPYIFGMDPVWVLSENAIIVTNSLKMKLSVILGVIHMMFGLTLSAVNFRFFKNDTDLYLVFLPQIIFFSCLFFYLVVLIFYKWSYFGGHRTDEYKCGCAPSILIEFINMMLFKQNPSQPSDCVQSLYSQQEVVQHILVVIALICIPILLFGKPLHFMYEHRRIKSIVDEEKQKALRRSTQTKLRKSLIYNVEFSSHEQLNKIDNERTETKEKLSEVWIHQGIHTIECVLGSISHTASYLRLWALSLAHSQLSHVLWDMVLSKALKNAASMPYVAPIIIFVTIAFFAVLTFSILVLMEGLSAFLHTLRLHWVEFQSKFYSGTGEIFVPFHFEPSKKRDAAT